MDELNYIKKILDYIRIDYTEEMSEILYDFYKLLIEKNHVVNLTAITEFKDVVIKHFADSLSVHSFISYDKVNEDEVKKVIDVGTGAGFPGIPLAIFYPELAFTLIDSVNKKLDFIQTSCDLLDISNVTVLHIRAEELAHKDPYREEYDICVSRAVSNLSSLSECCLPFLKMGGTFIAYKAANTDEEIEQAKNAITLNGGALQGIEAYTLPDNNAQRRFVLIRKESPAPEKYPRKPGIPFKRPLL